MRQKYNNSHYNYNILLVIKDETINRTKFYIFIDLFLNYLYNLVLNLSMSIIISTNAQS